jgi:hypothetical protein
MKLIRVGISEQKDNTWGRVYLDFEEASGSHFIFKNWIKFEEKNFHFEGSFINEPSYTWFDSTFIIEDVEDVIDGLYDHLVLTKNSKYVKEYGTPSIILRALIEALEAGNADNVLNRRNWYNK